MTQVDFNVIVAVASIGIWSKIIQTHFLLTQDLIITSSIIHSCSENAFLQCRQVLCGDVCIEGSKWCICGDGQKFLITNEYRY